MKKSLGDEAVYYELPGKGVYITIGFPEKTSPDKHANDCKMLETLSGAPGELEGLSGDLCDVVKVNSPPSEGASRIIAYQCINYKKLLGYYISYGSNSAENFDKYLPEFKKSIHDFQLAE